MCSRETNCSSLTPYSSSSDNIKNHIRMNSKDSNNRRCTLSDNITFRHRHRRYSTEEDLICERSKRSKLKCFIDHKNLSSKNGEMNKTCSNQCQPINSNSLISWKNFQLVILAIALMLSIMVEPASAFNVDVGSKVVHSAPRRGRNDDSMFGFSVAEHKEKGQSWLLIGAPAADSGQPGVSQGGAVYKCPPESPRDCEIIPFDREGNTLAPTGQQYDNKTGQWFGSLVRSSGEDGVVLACAPRYLWFSRNFKRREPVGSCYTAQNDFQDIQTHSPCRTRKWGYHRQGSCQAGLGAAIADGGNQMFIGAVGSWYWQGQVFSQNLLPKLRNDPHKTAEGSPSDDDSYLGYSVTTGEFDGDSSSPDAAVGMPRGAGLVGKVVLYNANLTNINNITGDQIGAYFGYSLASGDLDGDGLDDVIIGAPMWTNYEIMGKYETGRVYVVYQGAQNRFNKPDWVTLDGTMHKARFGLSVACAGNLNLDGRSDGNRRGIEDLLVGAPYDGEDHRGAIYVYLGSSERKASGKEWSYAQKILGKEVDSQIRTFGWSLSGGMDLDGNEYPDVLVGAYESANAVYIRSAPVVHLDSKVEFKVPGKQIDLKRQNCQISDGTRVPCVDIDVSMSYDGVGVPDSIELELNYILDSIKAKGRRLYFKDEEKLTQQRRQVRVAKGEKWKHSFRAYVHHPPQAYAIHDKLTSIDVEVSYKLTSSGGRGGGYGGQGRGGLQPVLGQAEKKAKDSISILKDCGDDSLCIPDLSIEHNVVSGSYVIGNKEKIVLAATIKNGGEPAFNARFYLQIPRGVTFSKANSSSTTISLSCDQPTAMNDYTLRCEIGNPLPQSDEIVVMVYLQPDEMNQDIRREKFTFTMGANSSNPEESFNGEDNKITFDVPLEVISDIRITGKSDPSVLEYNSTAGYASKYRVEDQLGHRVTHIYDLKNKGPSTIQEADVYILWPSFTGDEWDGKQEDLLYLLGVEYDDSKVTCQKIKNINPRYIKTSGSVGYQEALQLALEEDELNRAYNRESSGYYGSSSSSSSSWSSSSYSEGGSSSNGEGSYSDSSHSSSSSSQNGGVQASGGSGSSSSNANNVFDIARGPGDYHGTMSKEELEREAGGNVFTSTDEETRNQVENTRYHGQSTSSRVADGATETRLTDGDRFQSGNSGGSGGSNQMSGGGSGYRSSYDYEKSFSSGASSSSNGGSGSVSGSSSSRGAIAQSEWKLLENGTYIKVYHSKSTASGAGRGSSANGDDGNGYNSGSSDSGWVVNPDGTRRRQHSSWSSWSSSTANKGDGGVAYNGNRGGVSHGSDDRSGNGNNDNSGSSDSGWVTMPDGSRRREQSSWSSSSSISNSGNANIGSGSTSRGTNRVSPTATETRLSSSSSSSNRNENTNTVFNAARGPGNYHGTMNKDELERDAGGTVFGSTNTETRNQVDNTRYQGSGYTNNNVDQGSGGGASYREGSYYDQENRAKYNSGGRSRTGQSSFSSSQEDNSDGGQTLFGTGYSKSSSTSSSSSNGGSRSSLPKGQWVWDQTADAGKGKWEWSTTTGEQKTSSVTKSSGSQGGGQSSSDGSYTSFSSRGNVNSNDRGYVVQPNGTIRDSYSSWGSSSNHDNGRQNGRRTSYREESSYGGVRLNSEDADEISKHYAHGEILDHNRIGGNGLGQETGDVGKDSTGWVEQPDGTYVRKTSSWASWSKTGHSADGFDPEYLNNVQKQLEAKAKTNLHNGGNRPSSRTKRAVIDVQQEMDLCEPGECTLIQCKVGPMDKDEVLTFKIRSRLFTETQIKKFQKRVDISSKMIARVTRLPYDANPNSVEPQVGRVTTEVFPSDMGEATIPWWVWLLAALGGLLLLALIVYCLYKCGFFKRKRPDDSPEREPLNSNGYH